MGLHQNQESYGGTYESQKRWSGRDLLLWYTWCNECHTDHIHWSVFIKQWWVVNHVTECFNTRHTIRCGCSRHWWSVSLRLCLYVCVYVGMVINKFRLRVLHISLHISPLPCALCDKDEYRPGQKSCRKNYTRGQDMCVIGSEWYTSCSTSMTWRQSSIIVQRLNKASFLSFPLHTLPTACHVLS